MSEYRTISVDSCDVVISEALIELTEKIAKNTHDVWAVGKIKVSELIDFQNDLGLGEAMDMMVSPGELMDFIRLVDECEEICSAFWHEVLYN